MFMGLGMPIPDLSNKPGPGRPGWGPIGSYDFQFRVEGTEAVVIKANAAGAGNFRISWPNGTTQVLSGDNASITAPDATDGIVSINNENDTTYCDEFAVIGGKGVVREVISWGQNPWNKLASAFADCVNLTDISTTSLITDGVGNCNSIFRRCTSLLEIDAKNWQVSSGWQSAYFIEGCTNLTKVDMTGLSMKLGRSENWMENVGTNVADGCEFLMSGISFLSGSGSSTYQLYWFRNSKIKPTSTFASWSWDNGFTDWDGRNMFQNTDVTGVNSTLDASGWTTFPGSTLSQYIQSINYTDGVTNNNLTVDFTGLNVSNVNNMVNFAYYADVYKIKGISTWGATAGNVNMQRAFGYAKFLKTPTSDNFSNAFIQSLTPINLYETFASMGRNLPQSDLEASVNLNGLDVSNSTSFTNTWYYYYSDNSLDFSNVTFGSTAHNFTRTWGGAYANESNSTLNFPNQLVASIFSSSFQGTQYDNIIFGNNVDFSQVTTVGNMLASQKTGVNITFPTADSGLSFASLTSAGNWFAGTTGPTTGPLTTCQVDNLIRAFYNTALNNGLSVNFGTSHITESPSVVSTMVDELENTGGWNITPNTLDATIPFEYTGTLAPNTPITPTNNTGSAFTGTFSSSNSNIAVNATTGVINTPNGGNTTIRYTLDDGCYTEQAISLVSAEFSYSASAYCQDAATDPIPTVTGTSGGTFTAAFKFIPFQMQFEVAPNTEKTITIPNATGSSYTVDWGDGTTTTEGAGNRSHTYNPGGVGTTENPIVSINATGDTGPLTALRFQYSASDVDLIDIPQWGNTQWTNMGSAFMGCTNTSFTVTATDTPDLSSCVSLATMFYNCSNLQSINNISNWDVSNITSISSMFQNTLFNQDISSWNVSNVTNMSATFQNTPFNQDIDSWNVGEVLNMANMFRSNSSFNQDLNSWDVSKVTDMNNMFYQASSFNGNISNWNTGVVERFYGMFRSAPAFNQYIGSWNTSSATNMNYMFNAANSFNQDIGGWDVSNVTSFIQMLATSSFNNGGQSSINNWTFSTTSNINFQGLFRYASSFNQPINNWNLSRATNLKDFLLGASSFNQTVTNMISTIQNAVRIEQMFSGSQAQADWSQFPFQYADTSAAYAFQSNLNFTGNVSNWQIPSNVVTMQRMMRGSGITSIDFTDSVVGWAVYIYNNGGVPTGINFSGNIVGFDGTRTSDNTSGQTYTVKYSNWPSAWTNNNAQDAFDYLVNTLNWNI